MKLATYITFATFFSTATESYAFTISNQFKVQNQIKSVTGSVYTRNTSHGRNLNTLSPIYFSSPKSSVSSNENDPISTAFSTIVSAFTLNTKKKTAPETEEERLLRLQLERREKLAEAEINRQIQVREDAIPYLIIFALQLLPLVGSDRVYSIIYFLGLAVSTVYVGGRQETLEPPEQVSKENALYAPLGASVSIGLLYALLKFGIDPTTLYAVGVTIFGALAISDVGVPILRNVLPTSFAETELNVPEGLANKLKLNPPTVPLDGIVTLALGIVCTAIYWSPIAMTQKFIVSNVIAWSLAMVSLGSISLGSFQTASILLLGLFCYDIFWVFGTDVMMTVATEVEAPVKFLYSAPPTPEGATPRAYPFSVLGLGDVVIPGLFVRFMSKVDSVLKPEKFSYFNAAAIAYTVGLSACFVVNEITGAGQPALLYLDPACIGSALAVGAVNGQLPEVWNFEEEKQAERELL